MAFPKPFYRWRPHPWHGLETGPDPPELVTAYIELTPFDRVKYEVDKTTGYLRVDRPQRTSSRPPSLYGFIPRTYSGRRSAALSPNARKGDADPLDICVICERPVNHADIILDARVIGGLQMVDGGEADDKIIAVLKNDLILGEARDIADIPPVLIERVNHYFQTYKLQPGKEADVRIDEIYGREHAFRVVTAGIEDYNDEFGE